jgi:putative beta-lysine N-acetyltransferase
MQDSLESDEYGNLLQHGHGSKRIYLMRLQRLPSNTWPQELLDRAGKAGYSKIFAKVPERVVQTFLQQGFEEEARIPGFYRGEEEAYFLAAYLEEARRQEAQHEEMEAIVALARHKAAAAKLPLPALAEPYQVHGCTEEDVQEMAALYRQVFPSYPFPIHDPDYLLETLRSHVDYLAITAAGKLVALASAEQDQPSSTVEMTDFASLPAWTGKGFARTLLAALEKKMQHKGIRTAYTIGRAMSPGMNIVFAQAGYMFSGRLKNNTNISGQIESMNVWYKSLLGS